MIKERKEKKRKKGNCFGHKFYRNQKVAKMVLVSGNTQKLLYLEPVSEQRNA